MSVEFSKRIELELRGRKPEELAELNLDNCPVANGQISGITSDFKSLEILSITGCEINTLKDFPKLPELRKLEISENKLVGGLEHLKDCANITNLNMSGNLFKDASVLEPLKDLPNLKTLDLFNCPLTDSDNYREEVFKLLPQLVYLDGFDREDKEIDESDYGEDEDDDEHDDDEDGENDDDEGNDFDPHATGNGRLDDDDIDEEEEGLTEGSNTQDSERATRKRKHAGDTEEGLTEGSNTQDSERATRKRKHAGDTEEDESSQDG